MGYRHRVTDRLVTMHLGLRIAYDGHTYFGSQLQGTRPTIQLELERVLSILFRKPIRVLFLSRTDRGVHALDQWGIIRNGFKNYCGLSERKQSSFQNSLNSLLPSNIRVWQILKLKPSFHPKKSVAWKEYEYHLLNGQVCDPFTSFAWWVTHPLDLKAMKMALKELVGRHDFASFTRQSGRNQKTTEREILNATLTCRRHPTLLNTTHLTFHFRGTGFMHHMVRNIVGTLVEIGRGENFFISDILKQRNRIFSGPTAPPHGLMLQKIFVEKDFIKKLVPNKNIFQK